MKPLRIGILTDFHANCRTGDRRGDLATILVRRAVRRMNELEKPDVVLVLGDVVEDGAAPDAPELWGAIRKLLDRLDCPYIAIPGNHDADPSAFYEVFDQPGEWIDVAGARFMPFVDQQTPQWGAIRSAQDIERPRRARDGFSGPLIALHHVCLFPDGANAIPYRYENADAIIDVMREAGVRLTIGGHFHQGGRHTTAEGSIDFLCAPALSEGRFLYQVVTLDNAGVHVRDEPLALPLDGAIRDRHVHSELAYCGEDVSVEAVTAFAEALELPAMGFAEHSGQLYFKAKDFWNATCVRVGREGAQPADNRVGDYLALIEKSRSDRFQFGLEVDCEFTGRALIGRELREAADFLIGSIHWLPIKPADVTSDQEVYDCYLGLLDRFLADGIDILAHPFRLFRRDGWPPQDPLIEPVVELLRKHGVAGELNFHNSAPPVAFAAACLDAGVRMTLSSDTHALFELGDLAYHLRMLEDAGFDGDLADVLL